MAEADSMPIEAMDEEHLPATAGSKLRAAREAMGLTRADVSAITKINERHLHAVEGGTYSALPARIYAVGFARSYAGAVGLDAAGIAGEVRRELELQDSPRSARPAYDLDLEDPAKVPSKTLAWVAAALGVGLVVAGGVFWRSYFVPAVDLPPVREDMVAAATMQAPELTPAALVSPTAESAAGLASPLAAPPAAVPPAAAAQASIGRGAAREAAKHAPPRPVAEKLEPVPAASSPVAAPGPEAALPEGAAPPAG